MDIKALLARLNLPENASDADIEKKLKALETPVAPTTPPATQVEASRGGAPDPEKLIMQQTIARFSAEKLVQQFSNKIAPAVYDTALAMAAKDPEGFKAFAATLPDLPAGRIDKPAGGAAPGSAPVATDLEKQVFSLLGLSDEDVKKYAPAGSR